MIVFFKIAINCRICVTQSKRADYLAIPISHCSVVVATVRSIYEWYPVMRIYEFYLIRKIPQSRLIRPVIDFNQILLALYSFYPICLGVILKSRLLWLPCIISRGMLWISLSVNASQWRFLWRSWLLGSTRWSLLVYARVPYFVTLRRIKE